MKSKYKLIIYALCVAFVSMQTYNSLGSVTAREKKLQKTDKKEPIRDSIKVENKKPKQRKNFADSLKLAKVSEGLFTFLQDTNQGTLYMVLKAEQINQSFIYLNYDESGAASVGHFRGNFRDNKVFSIRKYFNRIEFQTENADYYFDSSSALSKASTANISKGILYSQKIQDHDKTRQAFLIQVDDLFFSEALHRMKPQAPRGIPTDLLYQLGSLNKSKSKYLKIKSYPQNADVRIEYIFENPYPASSAGAGVLDDRNISIIMQHSFVALPAKGYAPRKDDPRIGFFTERIDDLTSTSTKPYHDLIKRWDLRKKDPNALLSEPIQPIVWWIEKTTPIEFRSTIQAAALTWNKSFEKIGFKNALQVYIQPDTATWEAGDLRYNVLRWASSPAPLFGGYGPCFTNPLTGQILGADIMLEYVFVAQRMRLEKVFDRAGFYKHLSISEDNTTLEHSEEHSEGTCSLSEGMHQGIQLARAVHGSDSGFGSRFIQEALYYLVLHELGHTLGLTHNMKASQGIAFKDLHLSEKTRKEGLMASVMDYPAINIHPQKEKQGQYFTTCPGAYDDWAIAYGYSELPASDSLTLPNLAKRSSEKKLAYGNDGDDMRNIGGGIDPRVNIYDLSDDVLRFMKERVRMTEEIIKNLPLRYLKEGENYHELRYAFLTAGNEFANAASVMARYIGGVYVERAAYDGKSSLKPYQPVPLAEQKRAMQYLSELFLAPGSLQAGKNYIAYLQMQRRGFSFSAQNEDPKIYDRVLNIQKNILDHILHPTVLKRMKDAELYGNAYKVPMALHDLAQALFVADIHTAVDGYRQNIQAEYVQRLADVVKNDRPNYDNYAKSAFLAQLSEIKIMLQNARNTNPEASRHQKYLLLQIQKALTVK